MIRAPVAGKLSAGAPVSAGQRLKLTDHPTCHPVSQISLAIQPMVKVTWTSQACALPGGPSRPEVISGYPRLASKEHPMLVVQFAYLQNLLRDRLRRDDRGVTAVEYGLIVALIAGVIALAVTTMGTTISSYFQTVIKDF